MNYLTLHRTETSAEGRSEDRASVIGRMSISKGNLAVSLSIIREPSFVGENFKVGTNAHNGPYTAISDRCEVAATEVDDSIVLDELSSMSGEIVRSRIGEGSRTLSSNGLLSKCKNLVEEQCTIIYL